MQFDMLNIIKEKKEKELTEFLKEYGKFTLLSESAQFLDKRAYLTINILGELKRKRGNLTLPIFAYLNDNDIFIQEIFNSCDIREKQNFDKIERFSSLDLEKVKFNFIKTLFNGNIEFSKKYGKELFLRDRETFFKIVSNFSLIGESNNLKPLMVLSLKKLMTDYNENIFSLFISYITKYRDNTSIYENVKECSMEIYELKCLIKNNKELLNSIEGLGMISSLTLLENISVDNKAKALGKIKFEIENLQNFTPLNEREEKLLELFL